MMLTKIGGYDQDSDHNTPFPVVTRLTNPSSFLLSTPQLKPMAIVNQGKVEGKVEGELPPPDRPPPQPPSELLLPVVPQAPAAFAFRKVGNLKSDSKYYRLATAINICYSIEPTRAAFTTEGGVSKHMLMNHSQDRLAIKVRCSNNRFFCVNPVYSFMDCGSMNELEMIRLQGGVPRKDMIQLIYVVCRDNDSDASQLFTKKAKTRSLIVPLITI